MTKNWFLLSKEAMENFYLKKKKQQPKKNLAPVIWLEVGGKHVNNF